MKKDRIIQELNAVIDQLRFIVQDLAKDPNQQSSQFELFKAQLQLELIVDNMEIDQ